MKKDIKLYVFLGAIIAACAVIVGYSLISFNVIRIPKPYKPQYIELSDDELGSAAKFEGTTALVSIFADDPEYSWDFSSDTFKARRDELLGYTRIAGDWLSEQARKYGRSAEFVCAESAEDDLLYHEAVFAGEDDLLITGGFGNILEGVGEPEWSFIDENVDNSAIRDKYNCDNIVYLFFVNVGEEAGSSQAFAVYDRPHAKPYEYCLYADRRGENMLYASVIAHEIIHTFGAPDLYNPDTLRCEFEFTGELVEYCKENYPTDIMLSTKDPDSGVRLEDKINNEITDMTAYYIGWLDEAPFDVDGFKAVHSQHEHK